MGAQPYYYENFKKRKPANKRIDRYYKDIPDDFTDDLDMNVVYMRIEFVGCCFLL
jgi:hypothetical protein